MSESTKMESLRAVRASLGAAHQLVLDVLSCSPAPMTRAELAVKTGLRLSSVCGRVNELIALGQLKTVGRAYDPNTNRNVNLVGIAH